jgi:PBP1b-binding outer membrane lipoprotein LpoB
MNKMIEKTKTSITFLLLVLTFLLFGCSNNTNKMNEWANNLPSQCSPDIVKSKQPDYLEIDWDKPDTLNNGMLRYYVTKIKGNSDLLEMTYFLEFENNKFRALFAHK